jgi:hypothetical protein
MRKFAKDEWELTVLGVFCASAEKCMSDTVEGLLRQGAQNTRDTYICINLRSQHWQNSAAPWVIPSISEAPPHYSEHQDMWTAI